MEVTTNYFDIQLTLTIGLNPKKIHINSSHFRLGIMGHSGCGKSSFAKVLAGINPFFQGDFKFKERSYLDVPAWKRNFAYLPQEIQLIPNFSVKKNILFPQSSQELNDVIDGLNVRKLLDRMPRNLSGGEKQRVGLTRALCSLSDLLILDEPFSSLDAKTKTSTIEFLDKFTADKKLPMIVVSHSEDELKALKCLIVSLDA